MLIISEPMAKATTADVTATVLRTVARRPPMRAVADCRTITEMATEMANEVNHPAAYQRAGRSDQHGVRCGDASSDQIAIITGGFIPHGC